MVGLSTNPSPPHWCVLAPGQQGTSWRAQFRQAVLKSISEAWKIFCESVSGDLETWGPAWTPPTPRKNMDSSDATFIHGGRVFDSQL